MNMNRNENIDETPAQDVKELWLALDRLAAAEQAGAPAGLESRILARTPGVVEQPSVIGRIGRMSWGLRLAASIALVATVGGAVWLANSSGTAVPAERIASAQPTTLLAQVNSEFDEWLSASKTDTDLAALNSKLGTIESTSFNSTLSEESMEPSL